MMKKISSIKKKNNKYLISFDDNSILEVFSDIIIKYNLFDGKIISLDVYNNILEDNLYYEAFLKALKLLNKKLRTTKQVKSLLKEYPNNTVDKVISDLKKVNYLNDEVFINAFINDQINLGYKGPLYIKKELENLELPSFSLDEVALDIWKSKINLIINKRKKLNKNLSRKAFIMKMREYLLKYGYELDMINDCLANVDFDETNALFLQRQKELNKLKGKYEGEKLNNMIKYNLIKKGFNLENIDLM